MPLPIPEFERAKTIGFFRVVSWLLLISAGLWFVFELRGLILPFLIAIIIALTLVPEIDRMERKGWQRSMAILVIYAAFLVALALFLMILIPFISAQVVQISHLIMSINWAPHAKGNDSVAHLLGKYHVPYTLRGPAVQQLDRVPDYFAGLLNNLGVALPLFAGQLIWVILVPIVAFYILIDYHKIIGKILIFVKPDKRLSVLQLLNEVVSVFGNYVRGVVLMMVLDVAVTYVILKIAGVAYPETIAVLAGVLYAIPYLGAVISTVLIGLDALQKGYLFALVVLGVMILVHQFLFDQVIAPRVIGKQVGLHPLWAIAAMLIGGTLMGPGGTLIAIPLAACVRIVLIRLVPRLTDNETSRISELYARETIAQASAVAESKPPPEEAKPKSRASRNKATVDQTDTGES